MSEAPGGGRRRPGRRGRPRRRPGRGAGRRRPPRREGGGGPREDRGGGSRKGAPARRLAAGIVRGVLEGRGAARTHLERAAERDDVEARDLSLLTELVYGTLRRLKTLDLLLEASLRRGRRGRGRGRGLTAVEPDVLSHLRVGAYQLVFLEHVPPPVAVSEAVEATGRPAARGFVNGVLRGLGRLLAGRRTEDAPPADVPSTRRLPGRDGGWVLLREDLLPSAEEDPAGWLAAAASLPRELCAGWVARLGPEEALEVARAHDAPPPVVLRTNLLKTTREELLARLEAEGVPARPGERPEAIVLGVGLGEGGFEPLWAGAATVQDETAMHVAPFLEPQPGERIVDLCAAPGGKTTHLGELIQDRGRVDAVDVAEDRLDRVARAEPDDPRPVEEEGDPPIDAVLVDVPCSNTGVLRRRVELRHRLTELDLPELLALQARLLRRAVELVRPGGRVVYSTCSTEPAENQEQVQRLLAERPDVTLEAERATEPRRGGGDGGYVARLRVGRPAG